MNKKTKVFSVQASDKLQFCGRGTHDPVIRCVLRPGGRLDEAALREAVSRCAQAVPLLRCAFRAGALRARWLPSAGAADNILQVMDGDDEELMWVLAGSVNIARGPQLRLTLLRGEEGDRLVLLVSHLVCDGAGLRQLLDTLAEEYTRCVEEREAAIVPNLERGDVLLGVLSHAERRRILRDDPPVRWAPPPVLPLSGMGPPHFLTRTLDARTLAECRHWARQRGASVNDLLLCAYGRVLCAASGAQAVTLPCPVDLRRHLPPGAELGVCNLTGNYYCEVAPAPSEEFAVTLESVSRQLRLQKDSLCGLRQMLRLEQAGRLPFALMRLASTRFYSAPGVSYSNLGPLADLRLGNVPILEMVVSGAIKRRGHFQMTASTFRGVCTLSANFYGTRADRAWGEALLEAVERELVGAVEGGADGQAMEGGPV